MTDDVSGAAAPRPPVGGAEHPGAPWPLPNPGHGPWAPPPPGPWAYPAAPAPPAYAAQPYPGPSYPPGPYQAPPPGQAYPPGPYQAPPPGWSWPAGGPPPPPRRPRSPEERRRRRRFGLIMAGVLVVAVGAGIGIGAAVAPTSPAKAAQGLVTKAATAAAAAGSFRYVEASTSGGVAERIAGDAGHTGGQQLITQIGHSGTDVFHLRLVHGVVYFQGNVAAVVDQLGVSTTKAATVAEQWVKVTKGEGPYTTFAEGITAKSNIAQLQTVMVAQSSSPVAGSSPPETRIVGGLSTHGQPVGTATLVIDTATSRPSQLTANATGTTGTSARLRWTFGHYGEKVTVTAPTGAVPFSSLGVTSSGKGG